MLKLVSLSSGSCGNTVYIEAGKTKILVDAGTTLSYLGQGLLDLGVRLDEIDAILLTHEHIDHIRTAVPASRRHGIDIMANAQTLDALPANFAQADIRVFPLQTAFTLGELEIEAVPHSHDSQSPVGFIIRHGGKKICIATDLGRVTPGVEAALAGADAIVLEANHDQRLLATGRYPRFLKARVAGEFGHLSNEAAGKALVKAATGGPQQVLLAHLSAENNSPKLALETVGKILSEAGIDSINLGLAGRTAPSPVLAV